MIPGFHLAFKLLFGSVLICLTWARCSHWHAALWSPFHTEATQQTLLTTSRHPPESSYELTEEKKAVKKQKRGRKWLFYITNILRLNHHGDHTLRRFPAFPKLLQSDMLVLLMEFTVLVCLLLLLHIFNDELQ